jgi:hypothetical protein
VAFFKEKHAAIEQRVSFIEDLTLNLLMNLIWIQEIFSFELILFCVLEREENI